MVSNKEMVSYLYSFKHTKLKSAQPRSLRELDATIEQNREERRRWKPAEKSDRFLGKIEGESSLPVVNLLCYHGH